MFTGIVTHTAAIASAQPHQGGLRLAVPNAFGEAPALGESVAVNGCCLTVTQADALLNFDLSAETLARTAPRWRAGERVNLERALRASDRLGGHFVSGHVDGAATLMHIAPLGEAHALRLEAPPALARFLAEKGSVTLDGVALTVNRAEGARFDVCIIPHTWAHTTLSERRPGDALNLEIDLLARYAARLTELP